jgi:hypothetical protein
MAHPNTQKASKETPIREKGTIQKFRKARTIVSCHPNIKKF